MAKLIIEGGHALKGQIAVRGAKNAALPILAAAMLVPEPVRIGNCPRLTDVEHMVGHQCVLDTVFSGNTADNQVFTDTFRKHSAVWTDRLETRILLFVYILTFAEDVSRRIRTVCRVDDVGVEGFMNSAATCSLHAVNRPDATVFSE